MKLNGERRQVHEIIAKNCPHLPKTKFNGYMHKTNGSHCKIGRSQYEKRNRCKSKKVNKISEMCQDTGGRLPTTSGQIRRSTTSEECYLIRKKNLTKAVCTDNRWSNPRRGRIKRSCQVGLDSPRHDVDKALDCTPTTTASINSPSSSCRLHSSADGCYCAGVMSIAADRAMHDQRDHYQGEFLSRRYSPASRISHESALAVMEEKIPTTSRHTDEPSCAVATIRDRSHPKTINRCHERRPLLMSKLDSINHTSLARRIILTLVSILALQIHSTRHRQNHIQASAQQLPSDPRPTIYSGQVSFGLLLSAHSSLGSEMSTSASHQVNSLLAANTSPNDRLRSEVGLETLVRPRLVEMRTANDSSSSQATDLLAEASSEVELRNRGGGGQRPRNR